MFSRKQTCVLVFGWTNIVARIALIVVIVLINTCAFASPRGLYTCDDISYFNFQKGEGIYRGYRIGNKELYLGNGLVGVRISKIGLESKNTFLNDLYIEDCIKNVSGLSLFNLKINGKSYNVSSLSRYISADNYSQQINIFEATVETTGRLKLFDLDIRFESEIMVPRVKKRLIYYSFTLENIDNKEVIISFDFFAPQESFNPKEEFCRLAGDYHLERFKYSHKEGKNYLYRSEGKLLNINRIFFVNGIKVTKDEYELRILPGKKMKLQSLVFYNEKEDADYDISDIPTMIDSHKKAWKELWETQITCDNNYFQRAIDMAQFKLLCSFSHNSKFSIPPTGLSNDAWRGHFFWDTDIFMFRALMMMYPKIAKKLLNFRYDTMEGAKYNASNPNRFGSTGVYKGLFYAFSAGPSGKDLRNGYPEALYCNGNVVLNFWWYYLSSGDLDFFKKKGIPVITGIIAYSLDRLEKNNDKYVLEKVVGPDESSWIVNNNAYTNYVVKKSLEIFRYIHKNIDSTVFEELRKYEINCSENIINEIINNIYIPKNGSIILQYDGFKKKLIKQSDVLLMMYPLGMQINPKELMDNVDYYKEMVRDNGPAMSYLLPAVALSRYDLRERSSELLNISKEFIKEPYFLFSETKYNYNTEFLTLMGGLLQYFIFGIANIQETENKLLIDPKLNDQIQRITLKNFSFKGEVFTLIVDGGKISVVSQKPNLFQIRVNKKGGELWKNMPPITLFCMSTIVVTLLIIIIALRVKDNKKRS